jgi:hypothetical protein
MNNDPKPMARQWQYRRPPSSAPTVARVDEIEYWPESLLLTKAVASLASILVSVDVQAEDIGRILVWQGARQRKRWRSHDMSTGKNVSEQPERETKPRRTMRDSDRSSKELEFMCAYVWVCMHITTN